MLVGVETTMAPLSTGTLVPGQNKEAMDRATIESRSDTERLGTCCSALALASLFFARSSEMRCTRCKNALAARLTGLLRMKAMSPSNLPQPCQAATRAHKQQCKLPQLHNIPTTQVELQKLLRQAQRCPSTRQHPAPQGLDLGGLQVEVDRMRAGVERLARALEQHDVLQTATATIGQQAQNKLQDTISDYLVWDAIFEIMHSGSNSRGLARGCWRRRLQYRKARMDASALQSMSLLTRPINTLKDEGKTPYTTHKAPPTNTGLTLSMAHKSKRKMVWEVWRVGS